MSSSHSAAEERHPVPRELAALSPKPGSIAWERGSDVRGFLAAGYALLLQVSHPTVGAGVRQYSNYTADPWGRLERTVDYVNVLIYGGAEAAAAAGAELRKMHARIRGVDSGGHRYSALEPGAFAWVHATLLDAMVQSHAHFGSPMTAAETERFYREFRALGAFHGIREGDLPPDWKGFRAYFDEVVETRLVRTEAVSDLLVSITRPKRPVTWLPRRAWRVARAPLVGAVDVCTRGLLPPVLRERFGLAWSDRDESAFRAIARASRSLTPVLPEVLRVNGPSYRAMRERQKSGAAQGRP